MRYVLYLLLICSTIIQAEEEETLTTQQKIEKFSEFIGYTLGNQLSMMKLSYDADAIAKGVKKYMSGEHAALNSHLGDEMDLVLQIQEELFEKKAQENRLYADQFFAALERDAECETIIDKKCYIKKLTENRDGDEVTVDSSPLLRYSAATHENVMLSPPFEKSRPVRISLIETIPGFSKGVEGMRVGERRIVYVHPDQGYRRRGLVPPCSVIIFDVEVIGL